MEATNRPGGRGPQNRPGNRPVSRGGYMAANRGGNNAAYRGANQSANRAANGVGRVTHSETARVTQSETTKVTAKESEKKPMDNAANQGRNNTANGIEKRASTEPEKKIPHETEKATSQLANQAINGGVKETPNKLADKVARGPPNRDASKAADGYNKYSNNSNNSNSSNSSNCNNSGSQDGILKTGSFVSRDGLELKTYEWVVDKPVGIIILVHALNSHVRFEYLKLNAIIESKEKATLVDANNYYIYKDSWIEQFNKSGYSVYGLDMRGHGQSGCVKNVKTHVNAFQDLVYDVLEYANIVYDSLSTEGKKKKKENITSHGGGVKTSSDTASSVASTSDYDGNIPQGSHVSPGKNPYSGKQQPPPSGVNNISKNDVPPFYFMGLSMGGNIVLRILQLREKKGDESIKRLNIKGVITLAGMISLDDLKKKPEYKYFYVPMAKLASALLPTKRLAPLLKLEMFPYINDLFRFDPHCYNKPITNRLGNELLKAVDSLHNDIRFIPEDVQILIIHSVRDSACSYTGVSKFFNTIQTKNKELFTLHDMDHILPQEPGNERILKKVIDWLAHLQCAKG
ncbi:hypothetical protein C922_02965 [Plasmodium inui San Antonio 1]|uniref:Serine aminopeptidase S33 domain-containing protein n=1 Tax=Plasmodium inui San Antonio 1 TaxID=1237626 RepID=W7AC47_9APIC|nr:hypothetical protein C922_02965 [Plasmodium inui San Antonio 1]EUD66644.1 hypothetical protein C922_02965 [Plasmodium inui San Antonio 1]